MAPVEAQNEEGTEDGPERRKDEGQRDSDHSDEEEEQPPADAIPDFDKLHLPGQAPKAGEGKELLQNCFKGKEIGIGAFKCGNFQKAIECWSNACGSLQRIFDERMLATDKDQADLASAKDLMSILNLNLAQAHLKCDEFNQAAKYCDKVLEHDPNNVKALYRMASATMMASEFDLAREAIRLLQLLEPGNSGAKQLLLDVERREKAATEAGKRAARRMFKNIDHDPRSLREPTAPLDELDDDDDDDDWWRVLCCRRRQKVQ